MLELANTDQQPGVFTFVSEKEGSTLIEQFSGKDLSEALMTWYKMSMIEPGLPLEDDEPALVHSVRNVWCISGNDAEGKFFLTNIVATLPEQIKT